VVCPVFADDTREQMYDRTWMFATLLHERMEEYNEAWKELEGKRKALKSVKQENVAPIK